MISPRLAALVAVLLGPLTAVSADAPASPLTPEQERATFHFADSNLVAELVAAEPEITSPVAMTWDANGRLFVVEMTDYPSGPVSGRVTLLEQPDASGRFRKSHVFARGLAFPNGITPWRHGVLVTAAPDILFLADTHGDGVADWQEKLLTGFVEGNQQLRVNGLFWGLDNWIYGANGRSGGEVQWSGSGVPAVSIRSRDFRFRPDLKKFEAIAGHSQFGLGHDDWGNRFPVFNNLPIRHVVLEQSYLDRQPGLGGIDNVPSAARGPEDRRVFGLAPPLLMIPQPVGYFTSACGPSILRGEGLGSNYNGDAFVCEPVQNVVTRRKLVPRGATFTAERPDGEREFLASTDPWFHGVFTCAGPDGCLYVVDFYRKYVEHPHWVAEKFKTTTPWREGENHGRIWRIRDRRIPPNSVQPTLQNASSLELVHHLASPTGWWRDTAQRLLIERDDRTIAPQLEAILRNSERPTARLHALHTLAGLKSLSVGSLLHALQDPEPGLREQAARLAETFPPADSISGALLHLASDAFPRVRFQTALSLGQISHPGVPAALAAIASRDLSDQWITTAVLSSAGGEPLKLLRQFSNRVDSASDVEINFLVELSRLCARVPAADFFSWARSIDSSNRMFFLSGFLAGRSTPGAPAGLEPAIVAATCEQARELAAQSAAPLRLRTSALRVLSRLQPLENREILSRFLQPGQPASLQAATAQGMMEWNDATSATETFGKWNSLSTTLRRQVLAASPRYSRWTEALLRAAESGMVSISEFDPSLRQTLLRSTDPARKARAEKMFQADSDRDAVVRKFARAAELPGTPGPGALIFARACLSCHTIQGVGARVGPDLSGIVTHARETLLVDIFDPSRQVLPDFVRYTAIKADGEAVTGIVAAESADSVTLRNAGIPDLTLNRSQIKELKAEGKSLMPDGLEQGLSEQDVADLLEFLHHPDRKLLPGESR